jgi:hypothetical protein
MVSSYRFLAAVLLAGAAVVSGGCLFSEDEETATETVRPTLLVSVDSVYAWFPVDPGQTAWTWNAVAEGAWEYVWEASVVVRDWGNSLHFAFVRPSEGGPPQTGSLREMAAGASPYFWSEDTETGSWVLKPLPAGRIRVTDEGIGVRAWDSVAGWVFAYPPVNENFWVATFKLRDSNQEERVATGRVRYVKDRGQDPARRIRGPLSADEYVVMHVVLADYMRHWRPSPRYVLTPTSTWLSSNEEPGLEVLAADGDTEAAYFAARKLQGDTRALGRIGYAVIDADSFFSAPHDINTFYAGVSRVGFNRARNQALVYGYYHCGGLCGEGEILLLEKIDGYWLIRNRVGLWIS